MRWNTTTQEQIDNHTLALKWLSATVKFPVQWYDFDREVWVDNSDDVPSFFCGVKWREKGKLIIPQFSYETAHRLMGKCIIDEYGNVSMIISYNQERVHISDRNITYNDLSKNYKFIDADKNTIR